MCINPLFLCMIFLSVCVGIGKEVLFVFFIAFLHECGHAVVAKCTGTKIRCFRIAPWGICMETESFADKKAEVITACAGPIVNLCLLFIQFFWQNELFMLSNLFMLLINLLPVLPLDGGRVLKAFLVLEMGEERSAHIMQFVAISITILLFVAGVVLFYKTGINFSVLLIAVFMACTSSEMYKTPLRKTNEIELVKHYAVSGNMCLHDALKFRPGKGMILFDVLDLNCKYLGTVSMREVMEEIANKGYEINFTEILQKQLQKQEFCSTIDNV